MNFRLFLRSLLKRAGLTRSSIHNKLRMDHILEEYQQLSRKDMEWPKVHKTTEEIPIIHIPNESLEPVPKKPKLGPK